MTYAEHTKHFARGARACRAILRRGDLGFAQAHLRAMEETRNLSPTRRAYLSGYRTTFILRTRKP